MLLSLEPSWLDVVGIVVLGQFFQALLGGFSEASRADAAVKSQEAARQAELQSRILTSLAQSPDPEIQALALTGLLSGSQTQAKGKKGVSGLGGFISEIEQNPILPALSALINTPTGGDPDIEAGVTAGAGAQGFVGDQGVTSPLAPGTAAQAPRGTVEQVPGQSPVQQLPPFQPTTPQQAVPVGPGGTPGTTRFQVQGGDPSGPPLAQPTQLGLPRTGPVPTTPEQPRQVFPGPEQAGDTAAAERAGTIRGVLDALNIDPASLDEETRTAIFRGALGAPQGGSEAMNVIFDDGTPQGSPGVVVLGPGGELVDPNTGEAPIFPIRTFVPDQAFSTGGSAFAGRTSIEIVRDGKRFTQRLDPQGNVIFEAEIAPESIPQPPFPLQTGGTITDEAGVTRMTTRDRERNIIVGPPTGSQGEPQSVADAKGFERALASFKRRRAQGFGVPPSQELIDAEVQRLSDGLYQTEGELSSAAATGITRPTDFAPVTGSGVISPGTQTVPVEPSAPSIGDPANIRDTLDRLRRELQSQPSGR